MKSWLLLRLRRRQVSRPPPGRPPGQASCPRARPWRCPTTCSASARLSRRRSSPSSWGPCTRPWQVLPALLQLTLLLLRTCNSCPRSIMQGCTPGLPHETRCLGAEEIAFAQSTLGAHHIQKLLYTAAKLSLHLP